MGIVDLYNPTRVEKVLLYESDKLSDGDHILHLQVLEDKNPAAGDLYETAIDYAIVTTKKVPNTGTMLTINDSETGTGIFQFEFHGNWIHEGGYPDRFVGGDEHWTTTSVFGSNYPGVTFRFSGSRVALYGHKVPDSPMARITIDGKDMGIIDLYHPSRVEKTLLYESAELPEGDHSITMQILGEKNPNAGDTHEISIDYAVVTTQKEIPTSGVKASVDKITLETGMMFPLSYTLLPDSATDNPTITYESSNESVAKVDQNGVIIAVSVGAATVTLAPENGAFKDTVTVKVREPINSTLTAVAGDTNIHTKQENYYDIFEKLTGKESTNMKTTVWLRDTAAAKFDLLTAGKALSNIKVNIGELTNSHGDKLNGSVTPYFIKTVYAHDTGKYVPDVLFTSDAFYMPASSVASVWLHIETDADALPGVYSGEVMVTADGLDTPETLTLTVEVIGLENPNSESPFEIWQYPYSSNRYYSGKTTSEYFGSTVEDLWNVHLNPAYEAGLRSQIEIYAKAGGTSVTVTVTEDPWTSQTPDPYPSMVKWTQKKDGTFAFDYTDFDYFIELNEECGVTGNIMVFSVANWGNRITYYSEQQGKVVTENLTIGSERWKGVWAAFLTDCMTHTKEKGWFDRVYMAMDEQIPVVAEAVLDVVESVKDENGKCFKTALAVFSFDTEYLFDRVTNLSLAFYMTPERVSAIASHRRELGLETTLYTCGGQNSALSNSPIESVYTMWYIEQRGVDGFLRWALDAFNADPLNSTEHRLFAAGDLYLIYPDLKDMQNPVAHSSVRFEKLGEGVRDIAKYRWLLENYPEFEKVLKTAVNGIGGDLSVTVTKAQNELHNVGRRVALAELIKAAEALENAPGPVLTAAIATARSILEQTDPTENDLTEAAYGLSKALLNPDAPNDIETDTNTSIESDTDVSTKPDTDHSTETDDGSANNSTDSNTSAHNNGDSQKGCASVAGIGAVTVCTVAAVVVLKKKKEG